MLTVRKDIEITLLGSVSPDCNQSGYSQPSPREGSQHDGQKMCWSDCAYICGFMKQLMKDYSVLLIHRCQQGCYRQGFKAIQQYFLQVLVLVFGCLVLVLCQEYNVVNLERSCSCVLKLSYGIHLFGSYIADCGLWWWCQSWYLVLVWVYKVLILELVVLVLSWHWTTWS